MATIIARKRKKGTVYRADIRIKRQGKVVYQESRSFDRKVLAKDWAMRRELELQEPGAIERARHGGVTVGRLIERYAEEFGQNFGRSKRKHLEFMRGFPLAEKDALELQPSDLVAHVRERGQGIVPNRGTKVKPATINQDLIWLRVVYRTARTAWGIPLDPRIVDDASDICRRERLIGRPDSRDRRPTLEELDLILDEVQRRKKRQIPLDEMILFAVFSSRRAGEITRLMREDLDKKNKRILVRNMKHPTAKVGNNRWVYLTDEALAVLERQPENEDGRFFSFKDKSALARYQEVCDKVGVKGLTFHDLRHECISWLFEQGMDIPRVASISGHQTWSSLQRYTHLSQHEPFDKYDGWKWRPKPATAAPNS